ncbi:hypothetical protein HCUR_00406 [Holospora curviuscula]|uniref:Uncharacterized protein n=1 Tax=Holospora curviuscula TaxID=1082868 RepID=A0A2S5RAR6_9PROT|nr:hypothetical protein HCUR_00406 [Holospora curviuscula]
MQEVQKHLPAKNLLLSSPDSRGKLYTSKSILRKASAKLRKIFRIKEKQ